MTGNSNDSAEVMKFMTLFSLLKEYSDDAPNDLEALALNDSSVKELCTKLHFAAYSVTRNERRSRNLFAAPVDPVFITAWRDHEERYASPVSSACFYDIFRDLEIHLSGIDLPQAPFRARADLEWNYADDEAKEQANGIVEALDFAQYNAEHEHRWADQADFAERILDGVAAWERLAHETGFDLQGTFRRRALIPFVLVPRKVAAKHGTAEKLSMLRNLQEAHDAFVFGSTSAALALMRSVMEATLRDHYRAEGKDLSERIKNARGLPPGANVAALNRLRKRANAVLHDSDAGDVGLLLLDEAGLEKEVISFLFVLRALIEGAA
jgi:Domain of unknown function (DUF4145)